MSTVQRLGVAGSSSFRLQSSGLLQDTGFQVNQVCRFGISDWRFKGRCEC